MRNRIAELDDEELQEQDEELQEQDEELQDEELQDEELDDRELQDEELKDIEELEDSIYNRISKKINSLEENPRPNGITKLTDSPGYRIRVGDYRILFTIDDKNKQVVVYNVSHRKEVYKKN